MREPSVEEIVALIEKALADESGGWIACQEFQASELRALIADWHKRGEALANAWAAVRVRDENINATVKKLRAQLAALTPTP